MEIFTKLSKWLILIGLIGQEYPFRPVPRLFRAIFTLSALAYAVLTTLAYFAFEASTLIERTDTLSLSIGFMLVSLLCCMLLWRRTAIFDLICGLQLMITKRKHAELKKKTSNAVSALSAWAKYLKTIESNNLLIGEKLLAMEVYYKTNATVEDFTSKTFILLFGILIPTYVGPAILQSYIAYYVKKQPAEIAFQLQSPALWVLLWTNKRNKNILINSVFSIYFS